MADEETTEERATRLYYSELMQQCLQSERFVDWFTCNFDVHRNTDPETKQWSLVVVEVPPEVVEHRMMQLMAKKIKEDESRIVTASPADLKALELLEKK